MMERYILANLERVFGNNKINFINDTLNTSDKKQGENGLPLDLGLDVDSEV